MFSSDFSLFEFRGPMSVPVGICPSLLLLIFIYVDVADTAYLAYDLMFVFLLIVSVLLHELGHAWGCLIQKVAVGRVVLYAGGGYCEHSPATTHSEDELIVAMGPLVNLVLWAVCSLATPFAPTDDLAWVLATLSWINLWLAMFNLIPVQPLDGGKLFYLLLGRLMPFQIAERVAGGIGLLACVALVPALLYSWWALGFVLFFLPSLPLHWRMLWGRAM
ncbi:MAG: site-2 protease family protein [Pelagimonas sp.]|uniref:site-2 protease family protein n=1 Tax=Pelagimonas sp. TaxID=2073170 RepID=UPI003D6BBCB9